jgi:competence protein ComEC
MISLALQIAMLPLLARDFHRASLIGPLANIAAVPLTGVIVPAGFLALASSFVWHPLGHFLVRITSVLVSILSAVMHWCARFPHASYRIPGPPLWLVTIFFATLLALAFAVRAKQLRWSALLASVLTAFALVIGVCPFPPQLTRGQLEISVLDVGQGDSVFVAFPGGHTMLVDGGGIAGVAPGKGARSSFDIGEEVVSPYLWSRGLQTIDVVALTHAHQDHLGGLRAVLDNFHVGALWISREASSPALETLETVARGRGIPVIHHHDGETFGWDGVKGEVLWPPAEYPGNPKEAKNNDSLVLRLQFGGEAFLLPGDIERQAEHALSMREESLHSDFLKVAHHGSKTSTTQEFLERTEPRVGIISVGESNPYGHPHPDVLARLEASGAHVLRTDRDGAITIVSDGKTLYATCYVPCPVNSKAATKTP